ncbi:MAG: hypothetical protein HFJ59_03780 [Clostridia bacterium]|nr:hypothetical protein [Clostridia bacterium]
MFYIEKNDKPNWIEDKLKLIKLKENVIILPDLEKIKEKDIERTAKRTKKIIDKHSRSKKVVISKELQENKLYINYLNNYGMEIANGRWLFQILLTKITEYIISKKNIEKVHISILVNNINDIEIENIKDIAKKYKNVNVVTNCMERLKNIEKQLEDEGIIIAVTNNKKRSLLKSDLILNIDFPKELINKYRINENAIIVNTKEKIKINEKRFNGLNIHDYEIDFREDKKDEKILNQKYYLKDLYEAELYKKQRLDVIKQKIKLDRVDIKKLILNNGEL